MSLSEGVSLRLQGRLPWVAMQFQDPAQLEASERKVNRWCAEQGIITTADLGFFFLSYEEALEDAGRAVADAWRAARADSSLGLAVMVRQLFAAEEAGRRAPVPTPFASPRVQLKPRQAKPAAVRAPVPGKRSGYQMEQVSPAEGSRLYAAVWSYAG